MLRIAVPQCIVSHTVWGGGDFVSELWILRVATGKTGHYTLAYESVRIYKSRHAEIIFDIRHNLKSWHQVK
jgi:hypothetical protein